MAASLDSMWEGVDAVPPVQRDVLSKTRLTDWDLMRGLGEGARRLWSLAPGFRRVA